MSISIGAVWEALVAAGLLPPNVDAATTCSTEHPSDDPSAASSVDLLPLLIRAWQGTGAEEDSSERRRAEQWVQRLGRSHASGARLTLGFPGADTAGAESWLGQRLVWWPRGVPAGRRVALVSSRLGRSPDTEKAWFTVLRAACGKIDRRQELLLTTASTTTAPYAERSAALFGLRILRVNVPDNNDRPLAKWLDALQNVPPANENENWHECHLSPPLGSGGEDIDANVLATPLRDRVLLALSDRVFAFRVRPGGHVQHLLETRLRDSAWPAASVYVALGPKLVRTELAEELMDAGAVGWVVLDALDAETTAHQRPRSADDTDHTADHTEPTADDTEPTEDKPLPSRVRIAKQPAERGGTAVAAIAFPSCENWSFLTHCTRRREGPWPGQDEAEYLDDLILARPEAGHSALDALKRILRRQRLVATARTIRGGTPVVSFTAVPLAELHRLRVFRPHRGRWDFEPYGICIRRGWLQQLGAQPVRYGDDRLWDNLPPEERPFFQLRRTRRPTGNAAIDWSVEDEWRVVGDVRLERIPGDAALLFVPTETEAHQIAKLSRWPVTVVPAKS